MPGLQPLEQLARWKFGWRVVLAGITGGENDHGDDGNTGAEGELGVCLHWKRKGEDTYTPELLDY